MNIAQLTQALPYIWKAGLVPNLIGLHGTGKSQVVKQIAKKAGLGFYPLFAGQVSDAGEVVGLPEFDRDKDGKAIDTRYVHPRLLPKVEKSVLFIDELGHANKDIRNLLFQLVLEGQMLDYNLPANSHLIAAMNPGTEDYDGNDIFSNKAFADRFVHIIFSPTEEEYISFMKEKYGKATDYIQFLDNQRQFIEQKDLASFDLSFVKPSRRSGDRFQALINTEMPEELLFEAGMGIIGVPATLAYRSFLASQIKIPTGEEILNGGVKVMDKFMGENPRLDVIATVSQNIEETMKTITDLTREQVTNLKNFMELIPVENSYGFLLSLQKSNLVHFAGEDFRELISENADFVNKIVGPAKKARAEYKKLKGESKKEETKEEIPF